MPIVLGEALFVPADLVVIAAANVCQNRHANLSSPGISRPRRDIVLDPIADFLFEMRNRQISLRGCPTHWIKGVATDLIDRNLVAHVPMIILLNHLTNQAIIRLNHRTEQDVDCGSSRALRVPRFARLSRNLSGLATNHFVQ